MVNLRKREVNALDKAYDKIILFFIAFLLQMESITSIYYVLPLLLGVSITLTMDVIKPSFKWIPYVCFFISCILTKNTLYYVPLLIYDLYTQPSSIYKYLPFLGLLIIMLPNRYDIWFMMILASIVAIILKRKHLRHISVLDLYKKQRDSTKELTLLLEERNHDLLLKQDYEIRLATLNERNRIAREIHDNVGHLLSSSLLQVGALQAIHTQDTLQEPMQSIHATLDQAMNSIRTSVHGLHEDALQLDMEVQKLLDGFTFCEHHFLYDVEHPFHKEVIYHILSIVKEALHNVMKHSNATMIDIQIRELPKLYQMIIHDNGTMKKSLHDGIGLYNMQQRVDQLHGYINIQNEQGFRIFITLPKEKEICA